MTDHEHNTLPGDFNFTSYIATSYVKWVEAGGARAVPVIVGRSEEYYTEVRPPVIRGN